MIGIDGHCDQTEMTPAAGLAEHSEAFCRGRCDSLYGAERPRVAMTDPVRRSYMRGWSEGQLDRLARGLSDIVRGP